MVGPVRYTVEILENPTKLRKEMGVVLLKVMKMKFGETVWLRQSSALLPD